MNKIDPHFGGAGLKADTNPYSAPLSRVDDVQNSAGEDAEDVRKAHINHEASIKSVGFLHYFSAIMIGLAGVAVAIPLIAKPDSDKTVFLITLLAMLAMSVGLFYVGRGLRQVKPWVRTPAAILSGIGLLGFPVGTLINAYILWLLLGKKGKVVLSEDYQSVIAATPHIKYKTSIVVWIFLGLIFLVIAAAILLPMFAKQ